MCSVHADLELSLDILQGFLGHGSLAVGLAWLSWISILVQISFLVLRVLLLFLTSESAGRLHGLCHPLTVPRHLLHLFIHLCQLPVHLRLFVLQGALRPTGEI